MTNYRLMNFWMKNAANNLPQMLVTVTPEPGSLWFRFGVISGRFDLRAPESSF